MKLFCKIFETYRINRTNDIMVGNGFDLDDTMASNECWRVTFKVEKRRVSLDESFATRCSGEGGGIIFYRAFVERYSTLTDTVTIRSNLHT